MSESSRPRLDWQKIREQLSESQQQVDKLAAGQTKHMTAVYKRRAEAYAKRRRTDEQFEEGLKVIAFLLGAARYAIPLGDISEVQALAKYCPIPGASPAVLGLLSNRGEIRALIDLASLLSLENNPERSGGYVLFMRHSELAVSFRVDQVDSIYELKKSDLRSVDRAASYLQAITRDSLMVLNTNALFGHQTFVGKEQ